MIDSVVLVGETNPYGSDPAFALYHLPRHASGNRLRLILGLSDSEYEKIDKVNLCDGTWVLEEARINAGVEELDYYSVIVLLGRKVQRAFRGPDFFQTEPRDNGHGGCILLTLPHPSGLNPLWNDPKKKEQAREILKKIAPFVPWGSSST